MTTFGFEKDGCDVFRQHRCAIADILDLSVNRAPNDPAGPMLAAVAREKVVREKLLQLLPAHPEAAMATLLHLLAGALAGQLRFTDEERALLRKTSEGVKERRSHAQTD